MTANPGRSPSSPNYTPIDRIAKVLIVILIIGLPVSVLSAFFAFLEIPTYLLAFAIVILFLIWFYRAHRNLGGLGSHRIAVYSKVGHNLVVHSDS